MKTDHEVLMEDPEFRRLFAMEALAAEASELIARLMAERNLSKAELARKIGKSRSWITQLLSGKTNMTVCTLAEVVNAMDSEVRLNALPANWRMGAGSTTYVVENRETDAPHEIPKRPSYAA